ncbi:MAG: signal peptidase II [Acidimicrobiia bacterium]|nr:signal peptidase II [Acidimicrobiia bacterium]
MVVADQLTKVWAVAALADGPINLIGETLRFRLTRNPGAAFSSFAGGGPVLAVIAVIAAIAIALYLPKVDEGVDRLALSLIMGGALGNVADRFIRGDGLLDGAVIDFIDLSFWPTFNVADSAISVGVVLMLFSAFFIAPRTSSSSDTPAVTEEPRA